VGTAERRKAAKTPPDSHHATKRESISVVVIDDHEVVRCGLRTVLNKRHEVVGEAATSSEGLALCREFEPQVVIVDVRLDGQDMRGTDETFELIAKIRLHSPDSQVIVFSSFDNPSYIARAVAAGARDYVVKGEPAEVLLEAIDDAAVGLPPKRAADLRRIVGTMTNRTQPENMDSPLTSRETQVLRHIALGLSNKEIAETLSISVETVKEHVQNLLRKLAFADRTQAAVWAVRHGIA
jgi:DNA-binding NarL/FixJ family response regulator